MSNVVPKKPQPYQELVLKNKQLEYELMCIKTAHPKLFKKDSAAPDVLFAFIKNGKTNRHSILTTPFLTFELLQWLIGLMWLSGCCMGLSIASAAAGGIVFALLSFFFFAISILCVLVFTLSYLDAGVPEQVIEDNVLELTSADMIIQSRSNKQVDSFKELLQTYRETRIINRGIITHDS